MWGGGGAGCNNSYVPKLLSTGSEKLLKDLKTISAYTESTDYNV
jgi:hypothetical protein